MNEITKTGDGFVGYEYKTVTVDLANTSICVYAYQNFGWKDGGEMIFNKALHTMTLQLKRDRKIASKAELTRLQRNFEACMAEIEVLEKSKTSKARTFSIIIGLIGTAFMALSTFAVTDEPPHVALCILFAIPGFAGWGLPYFIHKKLIERRTKVVAPLIEGKYDEICELCRKGHSLL